MKNRKLKIGTLLFTIPCAFASSIETHICIYNEDNKNHIITVSDIDNYDWEGSSRPDLNFQNIIIPPGLLHCEREELNTFSGWLRNTAKFTFYIDGKAAQMENFVGTLDHRWLSKNNSALIATGTYSYEGFTSGSYCKFLNPNDCTIFKITPDSFSSAMQ